MWYGQVLSSRSVNNGGVPSSLPSPIAQKLERHQESRMLNDFCDLGDALCDLCNIFTSKDLANFAFSTNGAALSILGQPFESWALG